MTFVLQTNKAGHFSNLSIQKGFLNAYHVLSTIIKVGYLCW